MATTQRGRTESVRLVSAELQRQLRFPSISGMPASRLACLPPPPISRSRARRVEHTGTADKPDPDGAVPDEDSGGQPGPNGYIKALTTKEIEANTTSIAPGEVAGWQEWTLPALAKHTRLRWALTLCSVQGRSLAGTIAIHDVQNRHFGPTHLYVALSRARDGGDVWLVRPRGYKRPLDDSE